jgi:hypothetical protein
MIMASFMITISRTPGNSRKGQIPKMALLSGFLWPNFVRIVPGLPYIFEISSGSSDQGIFSPRIVRFAYLRTRNQPGHTQMASRASENLKMVKNVQYFSEELRVM